MIKSKIKRLPSGSCLFYRTSIEQCCEFHINDESEFEACYSKKLKREIHEYFIW